MPPTKGGKRAPLTAVPGSGKGKGKGKGKGGKGKGKRAPVVGGARPAKSGDPTAAGGVAGRPHRRSKATQRWNMYIFKILKTVYRELGISSRAMAIMSNFVEDMFDKIQTEAINIAKINQIKTVTAREVQTAARLILPTEIAKHALAEGTKSVAKYNGQRHINKTQHAIPAASTGLSSTPAFGASSFNPTPSA